MNIPTKMAINLLVFLLLAITLTCREMYLMHPDAVDWLN